MNIILSFAIVCIDALFLSSLVAAVGKEEEDRGTAIDACTTTDTEEVLDLVDFFW